MKKLKSLLKSYTFNICLILALTSLSMFFTLKDSYKEVIEQLQDVKVMWFIAGIICALSHRVLYGLIVTIQAKKFNPKYTLGNGISNSFIDAFASGVTPAGSGGNISQIMTLRGDGLSLSDSVSLLWMDSIIYQFCLVIYFLIMILMRFSKFASESYLFTFVLIGFSVNGVVLLAIWIISRIPRVHKWISTHGVELGFKFRLIKDKEKAKINMERQIDRFQQGVSDLKGNTKMIIQLIILDFLRLIIFNVIPVFSAFALGIPVSFDMVIDIMALSSFVSMVSLLFPVPGASGGAEPAYIFMFSFIFTEIQARSSMLLWRFTTYFFVLIIGAFALVLYRRKHL